MRIDRAQYIFLQTVLILYWKTGTAYAEYDVIQTQCQCTCPIERAKLQAAVSRDEGDHDMLQDGPYTPGNMYKVSTMSYISTTDSATTPTASPVISEEGSGYYVDGQDDVRPRRGDMGINIEKYKDILNVIDNPDDEPYGPPIGATSPDYSSKGDKGAEGPQGIPGLDGLPGVDGESGVSGIDGDQGPQGLQGAKGEKGDQGPRGYAGNVGLQGYRGPPGSVGEPGRQGTRGGEGPRGPRGEHGTMGQRGLSGKSGSKGEPGVPGVPGKDGVDSSKSSNKVAFLARLVDHFGPSTITTHVIFSQVDFNLGTGYDPSTGSFMVETEGLYVFHLQVMAMADYIAWLVIKVNGEPVAYAWASGYSSSTEQMGTAMTIQQLSRGDMVNIIQKASDNPPNYLYAHYTLFSGYLLG